MMKDYLNAGFRTLFICLSLILNGSLLHASQTQGGISGTWQGVLKISTAELRIVFHITQNEDGMYSATLDSPDQGASGIAVSSTIFKQNRLKLDVKSIGGTYEGTVNLEKGIIDGTWSQGEVSSPLKLTKVEYTEKMSSNELTLPESIRKQLLGNWQGKLKINAFELRVVMRFMKSDAGVFIGFMDSPDQGAKDIPISRASYENDLLTLKINSVGGTFSGKITGDKLTGKWQQRGSNLDLVLAKVDTIATLNRPQEPKRPYPYREEDVVYENSSAGVKLAGTLTMPKTAGPFPAVLLISGSGPQNRDEELLGHKPFLVLADYLTRQGLAVLRFDDRGTGKSTGDFAKSTSADFANDVLAGIEYLKSRSEIDPKKIGLIGHSEGGLIAPMVAAKSPDVAFIVMMAGPGITGEQILILQKGLIMKTMGASDELLKILRKEDERIYAIVKSEPDNKKAEEKIRANQEKFMSQLSVQRKEEIKKYGDPEKNLDAGLKMILSPWFRYFLTYDPVTNLKEVTCPVLALNGEKDLQVPPEQNLAAIARALKEGGNMQFKTVELPGLNHLFQKSETGAPAEYGKIDETVNPEVLKIMGDWIRGVTAK